MNVQSEAVCGCSAVTEPSRQRPATVYCPSPGTTCPDEEEEEGLVSNYTTRLHLVKTRTMKRERGPNIRQLLHSPAHIWQRSKPLDLVFVQRILVARKIVSQGQKNLINK